MLKLKHYEKMSCESSFSLMTLKKKRKIDSMVWMTYTQKIQRIPTNLHTLGRLILIRNLNINKEYFEIKLSIYLGSYPLSRQSHF